MSLLNYNNNRVGNMVITKGMVRSAILILNCAAWCVITIVAYHTYVMWFT